jgi:hypothetical protein
MTTALHVREDEHDDVKHLEAATRWLAEAASIIEVRRFRDDAEAARVLARQRDLGVEAENHAAELRIRAERRLGELLLSLPKRHGARPSTLAATVRQSPRVHAATLVESPQTFAEMGIDRNVAATAQSIARLPP